MSKQTIYVVVDDNDYDGVRTELSRGYSLESAQQDKSYYDERYGIECDIETINQD